MDVAADVLVNICAAGGDGGLCSCECVCADRKAHLFVSACSAALKETQIHRVQGATAI